MGVPSPDTLSDPADPQVLRVAWHWLVDTSALARLGGSPDAALWVERIEPSACPR